MRTIVLCCIIVSDAPLHLVSIGVAVMRLKFNQTKRGKCYYIIRSVYKNGKNTSETYEKLGYPEEIVQKYGCKDPYVWMQEHLDELNEQEQASKVTSILVPFNAAAQIRMDEAQSFQTGYLFLQKVYYELKLDLICERISKEYGFEYDLNEILSRLIYGRILYPSSKLATCRQSQDLLEGASFAYHDVRRALSVLADEFGSIQSQLYQYSTAVVPRKTGVLYYDCTNFYFETEQEDEMPDDEADEQELGTRKYGPSKQHQPAPMVQMGLFMDYSGIPLAVNISRGNKSEQETLIPLEKQIQRDFEVAKFIVCTDAGLAGEANRRYNNWGDRAYVTTVSIKKMKKEMRQWCLDPEGWQLSGSGELFNIDEICKDEEAKGKYYDCIFYKEQYIEGYDDQKEISFDRTVIVTFSLKYRDYLRNIRSNQLSRAEKLLREGPKKIERKGANDVRKYIRPDTTDGNGNQLNTTYSIDQSSVRADEQYDGFYAVETNLLDDAETILKINRGRWEIEESFRILKDDFLSRPVYLSSAKRIKAHFLTCFIALLVYRVLETQLDHKYTCDQILTTLRTMRMTKASDVGYIPSYTRTELTDALHENAGFRTDYQIIRNKTMKGILRTSKTRAKKS